MATVVTARAFDWGAATQPLPGESECGDLHVVESFEHSGMVALIDALGHGHEAAQAARVAAQALAAYSREDPVALVQRCHAALRGTRGAAISVGMIDAVRGTLTWIGVGNVAGLLVSTGPGGATRLRELLRFGGVVGDRLPDLTPSVLPVAAGDMLILTTDGIADYTQTSLPPRGEPQPLADRILARYAKHTDDAAVLVARLGGDR